MPLHILVHFVHNSVAYDSVIQKRTGKHKSKTEQGQDKALPSEAEDTF